MIRAIALPVTFLASAMITLAADQSSNSDEPGEFDIEPPILKQNLSDELAERERPTATSPGAKKNWSVRNEMQPARNGYGRLACWRKSKSSSGR